MISATVIEHTKSPTGVELVSVLLTMPKFLDAQQEKHRRMSSNSTSDRAMSLTRNFNNGHFTQHDVRKAGNKGMQHPEQVSMPVAVTFTLFSQLAYYSSRFMFGLLSRYVHKQHLNRFLLPWTYQRKIVTATREEWDYWLKLRDSEHADPAIQEAARTVLVALKGSTSRQLEENEWHLAFISENERVSLPVEEQIKISVARCARVSYDNATKTATKYDDFALYRRLKGQKHWSCFEHQALPMKYLHASEYDSLAQLEGGITMVEIGTDRLYSGNFFGFVQYRKLVDSNG